MNSRSRYSLLGMVACTLLAALANLLGFKPNGEPPVPPIPPPTWPTPPTPPHKPPEYGKLAPEQAIVRIMTGNSGCTGCIIGPRRPDGRWDILTAAHCLSAIGQRGNADLPDGRRVGYTVRAFDRTPDLGWLVTDDIIESLPYALLADSSPVVGQMVWHAGYGIDRPGNVETGRVEVLENGDGMIQFRLNVSSGDSGGPIFNKDSEVLAASVCCTTARGQFVTMFGGSWQRAARLRSSIVLSDWEALDLPLVPKPSKPPERMPMDADK